MTEQKAKARVLVVDDDETMAEMVRDILTAEGYSVKWAKNAFVAEGMLARETPDLLILDRGLPDKDGIEVCRELRQKPATRTLPVLFLTAKKAVEEKVSSLRVGGDEYLTKPFKPTELLAHVEALMRRCGWADQPAGQLQAGDIRLDLPGRKAFLKGKEMELWRKEYDLLQAFLEAPGRVLTRQYLLENVWGYAEAAELSTKVVDVTVGNLRRKLGSLGEKISAIKGFGYRFDP